MTGHIRKLGGALLDKLFVDIWADGFKHGQSQAQAHQLSPEETRLLIQRFDSTFLRLRGRHAALTDAVNLMLKERAGIADDLDDEDEDKP